MKTDPEELARRHQAAIQQEANEMRDALHPYSSAEDRKALSAILARLAALEAENEELRDTCRRALPEVRCLYQQATGKRAEEATGNVAQVLAALNAILAFEAQRAALAPDP